MNGQRINWGNVFADFQRYINEAKAEAWDEGKEAGQRSVILKQYTPNNPYREEP